MRRLTPLIIAVLATTLPLITGIARADQAGDELKAKMLDAYKNTKTYQATVHFEVRQQQGRWKMTQSADIKIAVDRAPGKIMIDKPDLMLATDGTKLRAKTDQVPDHYVETASPAPLDYDGLTKAVLFENKSPLARPPLPDLILLLAADPIAALNGGRQVPVKAEAPAANDPSHRPGLRFVTSEGRIVLRLDPATFLVTSASIEISALNAAGDPDDATSKTDNASLNYEFAIEKRNQPLDAAAFAFDTTGLTAVGTMQELAGTANGGASGGGASPLEGKAPPGVKLKTLDGKDFDLADEKADVVVLDFWATWCGPCREGLPKLQKVADWARKEKKSVAFYPINVQETPIQVKAFWEENKYTMPVLMDSDNKVAESYHVEGIPQTVVISKGKVVRVIVGLDPDEETSLKAEIEGLLKK